jgi:hypothetical protein
MIPRYLIQLLAIRILIPNAVMKIHRAIGIKNKEKPPFCYLSIQRNKHLSAPGNAGEIPLATEDIFYCKSVILFLSSSKILTSHPPLRPASVYPPPLLRGEDRLDGRRGGWGVNILEDERNRIALLQ